MRLNRQCVEVKSSNIGHFCSILYKHGPLLEREQLLVLWAYDMCFQWIQQKCSNLDVVYSVEVHTISMTSYRVILRLNFYEKLNWGSAFYSVVADPIIFSTTNKLFDNNIVTAWQQLLEINWGVRKLLEKIGVRQGSAGSAGVRRGPQNNWTPQNCIISPKKCKIRRNCYLARKMVTFP